MSAYEFPIQGVGRDGHRNHSFEANHGAQEHVAGILIRRRSVMYRFFISVRPFPDFTSKNAGGG